MVLTIWTKSGLGGAAHEEAVHVGEGGELLGVGGGDAAAVEDAEVLRDFGVDIVLQPLPQRGVDPLGVLRRGGPSRPGS